MSSIIVYDNMSSPTYPLEESHSIFTEVFGECDPAVEDAPEEVLLEIPHEGGCTCQHLVHQYSQRPEIAGPVVRQLFQNLKRNRLF